MISMERWRMGALALGLGGWLSSCSQDSHPKPTPPGLVLYLVDTLRADRLGAYGYPGETSPNFDRLCANEGVRFDRCTSCGPWTLPSMASLWSGVQPLTHRVLDRSRILDPSLELWPERLGAAGYQTAAFVQNPIAGSLAGVAGAFEVYRERGFRGEDGGGGGGGRALVSDGQASAHSARTWIAERTDERPLCLWVHTVEPHIPYAPEERHVFGDVSEVQARELNIRLLYFQKRSRRPQESQGPESTSEGELAELRTHLATARTRIEALYDSEVRRADEEWGSTVERLQAEGLWQSSWVVFTSDHGEELLDHGYWLHGQSLYDELLRVPLWIKPPGASDPRTSTVPASLVDLAPTLADALGFQAGEAWEGHSLLPFLLDGEPDPAERMAAMDWRRIANRVDSELQDPLPLGWRGRREVSWQRGPWKLHWRGEERPAALFRIDSDPAERDDLIELESDQAGSLEAEVRSWVAERARPSGWSVTSEELDSSQRAVLDQLGYGGDSGH